MTKQEKNLFKSVAQSKEVRTRMFVHFVMIELLHLESLEDIQNVSEFINKFAVQKISPKLKAKLALVIRSSDFIPLYTEGLNLYTEHPYNFHLEEQAETKIITSIINSIMLGIEEGEFDEIIKKEVAKLKQEKQEK